jgi:phenylacetate-CoA ligase
MRKLRSGLANVLTANGFWRDRLHDVRGWDDFERLPLTTKVELIEDQAAHSPFGTNLTYPMERFVRVHQTSGSTARCGGWTRRSRGIGGSRSGPTTYTTPPE